MSLYIWTPSALPVQQVQTYNINAVATALRITIGAVDLVGATGTSVQEAFDNLNTALNATDHPYFIGLTLTYSALTMTISGDEDGMPFTAVVSEYLVGTPYSISPATTVSPTSMYDYGSIYNWRVAGAVPATLPTSSDDVLIDNTDVSLVWGASISASTIVVGQNFTGNIGLNPNACATDVSGTTDRDYKEYRSTYNFDCLSTDVTIRGGNHIFIRHNATTAGVLKVESTVSSRPDNAENPVNIYLDYVSTVIAPTFTLNGDVSIFAADDATSQGTRPIIDQKGGNLLLSAPTVKDTTKYCAGACIFAGTVKVIDFNIEGAITVMKTGILSVISHVSDDLPAVTNFGKIDVTGLEADLDCTGVIMKGGDLVSNKTGAVFSIASGNVDLEVESAESMSISLNNSTPFSAIDLATSMSTPTTLNLPYSIKVRRV